MSDGQERQTTDGYKWEGKLIPWKKIATGLVIFDIIAVNLSYFAALLARFELHYSQIKEEYLEPFLRFAFPFTIICIIVFFMFRLYNSMWKYAGFDELIRIVEACVVVSVIHLIGTIIFTRRMPLSYYVIGAALQLILTIASRFSYRMLLAVRASYRLRKQELINVMIIGTGPTAQLIIRELMSSLNNNARPVCIISEQSYSWGRSIEGIPIAGGKDVIAEAVEKFKVSKIVFADPSLPLHVRNEIMSICESTGCDVQNFSGSSNLNVRDIPLRRLIELVNGRLILSIDGKEWDYETPLDALAALHAKYNILGISAKGDCVKISLDKDIVTPADMSKQWEDEYLRDNGESPSFF